jgi:hypothetical protein
VKEISVASWDDLDYKEGIRTPADGTVRLVFGSQIVDVDLSAKHQAELAKSLAPYLEAGTRPDHVPAPRVPGKGAHRPGIRAYNAAMRKFADERGLHYTQSPTGKPFYPKALQEAYAAHLEEEAAKKP